MGALVELLAQAESAIQEVEPTAAHREVLVAMTAQFTSLVAEVERLRAFEPEQPEA